MRDAINKIVAGIMDICKFKPILANCMGITPAELDNISYFKKSRFSNSGLGYL